MKLTYSAFGNDHLHLTRWDLVRLFCGARLKVMALVVETAPNPKPAVPGPKSRPLGPSDEAKR